MVSEDFFEFLEVDEFAKKMRVGRTTVFKWKKEKVFVRGEHFIKRGRKLLFLWSKETALSIVKRVAQIEQGLVPETVSRSFKKDSYQGSRINLDLR